MRAHRATAFGGERADYHNIIADAGELTDEHRHVQSQAAEAYSRLGERSRRWLTREQKVRDAADVGSKALRRGAPYAVAGGVAAAAAREEDPEKRALLMAAAAALTTGEVGEGEGAIQERQGLYSKGFRSTSDSDLPRYR